MTTQQEKFWQSSFGTQYINRNDFSPAQLDELYLKRYGVSRSEMNQEFLSGLDIATVLEIGANIGNQLLLIQNQYPRWRLFGIEINDVAAQQAQQRLPKSEIVVGSTLSLPYQDKFFDLVFTAGVLIHIHPQDLPRAVAEIHRVSKKYIWGSEYWAPKETAIDYRGNKERLWKNDFAGLYQKTFPDLVLIKEKKYPYRDEGANIDSMFLLKKDA